MRKIKELNAANPTDTVWNARKIEIFLANRDNFPFISFCLLKFPSQDIFVVIAANEGFRRQEQQKVPAISDFFCYLDFPVPYRQRLHIKECVVSTVSE